MILTNFKQVKQMMNKKLFWIGIQESEIEQTHELFAGSITIFGSNKNGNFSLDKTYNLRYNYNLDSELWFGFVNSIAQKIVKQFPECSFMLYYPMDSIYYGYDITSRIIGINDLTMLDIWDNKFKCRAWLSNDIPTVPNRIVYGEEIKTSISKMLFCKNKLVVQCEYSCGGSGTWLLTNSNKNIVLTNIELNKMYLVSEYLEHTISVNVHLVIYNTEVIILPASIQLIQIKNYSFEYCGADFIAYQYLPHDIKNKVQKYSIIIGERLRRSGYRGVCGIDYLTTNKEVYFSEINPRFQSSTFLLNNALNAKSLNYSVQQLHLDAFLHKECQFSIPFFKVNYSYYKITYSTQEKNFLQNLAFQAINANNVTYIDDGLLWEMTLEEKTYLYKLIFKQSISAISHDYDLIVHPNLYGDCLIVKMSDIKDQMLELKIMLLSHGLTISYNVQKHLEETSGINYEEFNAVDLIIQNKYYINVPYKSGFSSLSPFQIKEQNGELWLFYCDNKLLPVFIRGIDKLAQKTTKCGIKYSDIGYLGFDRLRIYHRLGCYFKEQLCGCGFCDLENDSRILTIETIKEVIDAYALPNINHYLIGGGSQAPNDDFERICDISKYLKSKGDKPIYLMSLPINNITILQKLKQSGITQVAFNIEVFDRNLARKYMPGKGHIPLQIYYDSLKKAVKLWGSTGNVRSIIIVGLESKESLLSGIEKICQIGVSPILSLLKPIAETPLHYLLPPCDREILDIVIQTECMCKKYNIPLGPTCCYCEDNTLKISRS